METNERKEIVQLNGLTILVVMALIADFLIVGFMYRWHGHRLFAAEKIYHAEYSKLLDKEHDIKTEVVALEGAASWNETAYVRAIGKSFDTAE